MFFAGPIENNLFIWHFTIKGPLETVYEGGLYHGKVEKLFRLNYHKITP